jgi:hypothetical protein
VRSRENCAESLYSFRLLIKNVLDCGEGNLQGVCVTILLASNTRSRFFNIARAMNNRGVEGHKRFFAFMYNKSQRLVCFHEQVQQKTFNIQKHVQQILHEQSCNFWRNDRKFVQLTVQLESKLRSCTRCVQHLCLSVS